MLARKTYVFQEFLRFSQFPLWRVEPVSEPENAKRVQVVDMRFGTPTSPAFTVTALVDSGMRVLQSSFQFGPIRPR